MKLSNILRLATFEYKKIFNKKSSIISLSLILLFIIISAIGNVNGSSYSHQHGDVSALKAMQLDREVIRSKAGFIDKTLVKEAIEQNQILISNEDNYIINKYGKFVTGDAYIKYVLPYENIVKIINVVFSENTNTLATNDGSSVFNNDPVKPIDTLTEKDASMFYEKVQTFSLRMINDNIYLSQSEKYKLIQMLDEIKLPFYNDYFKGWQSFSSLVVGLGVVLLVAISICIAPIFASEYSTHTDQIILASKFGKNQVILAKLLTGLSFSIIVSIISFAVYLLTFLCIFGFDGYDVNLQLFSLLFAYPITMLQSVLIAIAVALFVISSFSMFVMLVSALSRSAFPVIIISFLIIFVPTLIHISITHRFAYQLVKLFPSNAVSFELIFEKFLFNFGGFSITTSTVYIVASILEILIMFPFAYRGFKNHQIL